MKSLFVNLSLLSISTHIFGATAQTDSPLTSLPLQLSKDDSFNFQLLSLLGHARYAGANVAEILAAAKFLQPGDFSSFNSTFATLANHSEVVANTSYNSSDGRINVRDTFFAAATYWRAADFYLHGNWSDPLIDTYWTHQLSCFNNAMATLPVPGERVTIPAEGFDTIGIYYGHDKGSTEKRPTMLVGSGYDGSQEDSYHQIGIAALAQGWNVLTYEGPGQPTALREQGKGFIHDWERVLTPAVDYLSNRSDVDMDRLALVGISLGGYLAARAAAFEPRIKALLLNDGVYDVFEGFSQGFGPLMTLYNSGNKTYFDEYVNEAITFNTSADSAARWGIQQGLWSFNTHSPYDWLKMTELMTLANITDRITMPTWIGNAVNDFNFPGQAMKLQQALGSKATLHNFTGPASYHCEVGAFDESNRVMLEWLDEVLPPK